MTRSLGIDLGLNSIKMAYIPKGEPVIITDRNGGGEIPAFVGFGKGREILVGQTAKNRWQIHPEFIVYSPATFLGKRIGDPVMKMMVHQFGNHVKAAQDGSVLFKLGEIIYTPVELTTLLFVGIKELAEEQTQLKFDRCVISVPAHFGERQVVAVKKAAQLAGFFIQQVVNQPTAVALNFGLNWENPTENKQIFIYNLGSSFDSSILSFNQGRFKVRSSIGDSLIGGDVFTEKLAQTLNTRFFKGQMSTASDPKNLQRLWVSAEDAKVALSKSQFTEITLPITDDEAEAQECELNREIFEQLISSDLEQTIKLTHSSLQQAHITPDLIDFVIPVGGSSLIPFVEKMLSDLFGKRKIERVTHALHGAAYGAAIHTAMSSSLDCPHCGKSNSPQDEICRHCGQAFAPVSLYRCTNCYLPNDITRTQCWKCGTAFTQIVIDLDPKNVKEAPSSPKNNPTTLSPILPQPVQDSVPLTFEYQFAPKDAKGYFIETSKNSEVHFIESGDGTWQLKSQELTLHSTWRGVLWAKRDGDRQPMWIGTLSVRADPLPSDRKGQLDASIDSRGRLLIHLQTQTPKYWQINFWQGQRGRLEMKIARNPTPLTGDGRGSIGKASRCSFPGCVESSNQVCPLCGCSWCQNHVIPQGSLRSICIPCAEKLARQLLSAAAKSNNISAALSPVAALEQQAASASVAQLLKGLIYAEQGKVIESIELLEPLASGPTSTQDIRQKISRLNLTRATQKATDNDLSGAAQDIAKAFSFDPDLKTHPAALPLFTWQALSEVINGNLPGAVRIWEQELQNRPGDFNLIHNLAVIYYRLACEREQQELSTGNIDPKNTTEIYWKKVVAFWPVILYSRNFWDAWIPRRLEITQAEVNNEDISQIRKTIEESLTQDFRNYEDEWNKKGTPSKVKQFHNLDVTWGLERETAKILGDLALEYRVSTWPRGFTCGPSMLETMATYPGTKPVVIALRQALPNFTDSSGQRLQKFLSPMGRHQYLIDTNLLDQAIEELETVQAWPQAQILLGYAQSLKGAELLHMNDLEAALLILEKAESNGANVTSYTNQMVALSISFSKENLDHLNNAPDGIDHTKLFDHGILVLERVHTLIGSEPTLCAELAANLGVQSRMALKAGRIDESEKIIRRSVLLNPQDEQAKKSACIVMFNIAVALADQNPDRALYYIQQSLTFQNGEEDRKDASGFLFMLASKAVDNKRRQQAVQYMMEAIRYDPDQSTAATVSEAKRRIKNYLKSEAGDANQDNRERQALGLLEEARNYGDDAELLYFIAILYGNMGQLEEKLKFLSMAYREDPSNSNIREAYHISLHNRGVQYANQDRYDQAINDLISSLKIIDNNDTRKMLAQCYALRGVQKANNGDRYGAINDIDQALKYDPYNSDFRTLKYRLS